MVHLKVSKWRQFQHYIFHPTIQSSYYQALWYSKIEPFYRWKVSTQTTRSKLHITYLFKILSIIHGMTVMTSLWLCNFSCVSLAGRQAGSVSRPCHDQGRFQPDTLKHRETVSWEVCCHLMLIMTWGWLGLTSMIHPMFLTRMSHLVTQSIWRWFVHKKAKGPMSLFQAPPGYQEQTTKAWQGWFYRRFPDKDYHWSESSEEDTQMYQDWYNSTGEHYNSSHHGRSAISSSL